MKINNCSKCNVQPGIQSDELGIIYRLICTKCGKCTRDKISPTASLNNPHCDEDTLNFLVQEWNGMN